MPRHLADHRAASGGARVRRFLAIARSESVEPWRAAWQRPPARVAGNRRLKEYVRISRAALA